jgi:hypothetical protein
MSLVADFEHLYLNDFFMDRVDKECPGSITISDNGQFIAKSHHEKHKAMEPIEADIRKMTR